MAVEVQRVGERSGVAMMRAALAERPGGPEGLVVRDVPPPRPRPGWASVRVEAFGLDRSEYALLVRSEQRGLVDAEQVPSEMGPPRKVRSLNAQGQEYLEEFWRTWSFLTERLEQLHEGGP